MAKGKSIKPIKAFSAVVKGKPGDKQTTKTEAYYAWVRKMRCGACSHGKHADCSQWCFCDCPINQ